MKSEVSLSILFLVLLLSINGTRAVAKKDAENKPKEAENTALIIGEEAEQYHLIGTGGIKVTGGHRGIFVSNWKSYTVEIDGSGISAGHFKPVSESGNFTAEPGSAHFVSQGAVCTLAPAQGAAGEEIVICNTSSAPVSYQTSNGEELVNANQAVSITNSSPGKVDRFISDGKAWYKE